MKISMMMKITIIAIFFINILFYGMLTCNNEPSLPADIISTPNTQQMECGPLNVSTPQTPGVTAPTPACDSCFCSSQCKWNAEHNGQIVSQIFYLLDKYCFFNGSPKISDDNVCLLANTFNPLYTKIMTELLKDKNQFLPDHIKEELIKIFNSLGNSTIKTAADCENVELCSLMVSVLENIARFPSVWKTVSNLPSASYIDIFFDSSTGNTTIWVCTKSELFQSTDTGKTWNQIQINDGVSVHSINKLFVDGTSIFLAMQNGLAISLDQGANWNLYNTKSNTATSVFGNDTVLDIYEKNGVVLAATASGLSFSNSIIAGNVSWTTWNKTNTTALTDEYITCVYSYSSINNKQPATDDIYTAGTKNSGLFVYNRNVQSWTQYNVLDQNNTIGNVTDVFSNGTNIFVATSNGLFITDTTYSKWFKSFLYDINRLNVKGNNVYLASSKGIFTATDAGQSGTWNTYTTKGLTLPNFLSVEFINNNIYAGTNLGVAYLIIGGPLAEIYNTLIQIPIETSEFYQNTITSYVAMINLKYDAIYTILNKYVPQMDTDLVISKSLHSLFSCPSPPCKGDKDPTLRDTLANLFTSWILITEDQTTRDQKVIDPIINIFKDLHDAMQDDDRKLLKIWEPQFPEFVQGWLTKEYNCP